MFMVSSDRDERLGRALIRRDKLRMRRSYHLQIGNLGEFVIFYDDTCNFAVFHMVSNKSEFDADK